MDTNRIQSGTSTLTIEYAKMLLILCYFMTLIKY